MATTDTNAERAAPVEQSKKKMLIRVAVPLGEDCMVKAKRVVLTALDGEPIDQQTYPPEAVDRVVKTLRTVGEASGYEVKIEREDRDE